VTREGLTGVVWFLAVLGFWTLLVRGALHLGGNQLMQRMPSTKDFVQEVERYGWIISLALGAMITAL
jgi:hypothetical protein